MKLTAITVTTADGHDCCLLTGNQVLGLLAAFQSPKLGVKREGGSHAVLTAHGNPDNPKRLTIDMLDGLEVDSSAQDVLYRDHCHSIGRGFSMGAPYTHQAPNMVELARNQLVAMSNGTGGGSLFVTKVEVGGDYSHA
ncbi:MAG: hypothetical protein ACK4LR_09520 [Acidovorax temperans]|uniref:hypothetical protein n=1 Tax=Acidovorax temperans TaxID=80878 RepID=UPI00391AB27A